MDFQGSQTLAMPLLVAWNFLADVNNVVSCVPGFQKLDEVATNQWKAVIGISVGFVRTSFPVEITRPVVEEQRRIAFRASGKASGSSVEMFGDMTLVATGNGETRMDWKTSVNVGGLLARVPAGILASTMERGSNTFFDALTKQMESSGKQGSASAILAPVAMAMSTPAPIAPSAAIAVPATASPLALGHFMWRWPWYLIAGLAAIGMGLFSGSATPLASSGLLIFALLALLIMLIERTPEALIVPAGLAALAIWRFQVSLQASISISLLASSLLCVLIFASRFLWNGVTAKQRLVSPAWFPVLLALCGQLAVIGIAIAGGSLASHTGSLASHTFLLICAGATTLLIFTLLILWSASLLPGRPALRRWCYYCAGLLIGLCISWCLLAFVSSDSYEYFTIAPAISLSVMAPFLIRDKTLPGYRQIGQAVAIIATIALLLPTAAVGYGNSQNLIPVELFMLEAVALFLLGLLTRTQIFTYGGATLVVLGVFSAFSFFISPKATQNQQTSIIASIVIYAIICVAASIFFVSRDRRKKE